MKTIYKYKINITHRQVIRMPVFANILTVQNQNDEIVMWAEVDDSEINEDRVFLVSGTGTDLPSNPKKYLGTVQITSFVWHIFEVLTTN